MKLELVSISSLFIAKTFDLADVAGRGVRVVATSTQDSRDLCVIIEDEVYTVVFDVIAKVTKVSLPKVQGEQRLQRDEFLRIDSIGVVESYHRRSL